MSLKEELCKKLDIFTSADVIDKYVDDEIIRRIDDMILLHKVLEEKNYGLKNRIDELNNLELCLKQLK